MKKNVMVLVLIGCLVSNVQANLLLNGGFEDGDLGQLGSVTINNWITWGDSGWHHNDAGFKFDEKGIKLWHDSTGVYQDFDVVVGTEYTVGLSAITAGSDALKGWDGVVKIEWTDASWINVGGSEVGRFYGAKDDKGIAGDASDTWKEISGAAVAPAGAVHGRLVYYLEQADNWESTTGGSLYWDNAFVTPEPATLILLGLGSVVLGRCKK